MKTWIGACTLVLLAAGCGDSTDPTTESSADASPTIDGAIAVGHRYFEHRIDGCNSGGIENCAPSIELCADGSGTVLVTDILNSITYEQDDRLVSLTRVGPGDIPESFTLELVSDEPAALDDWLEWNWSLVEDPAFSSCD